MIINRIIGTSGGGASASIVVTAPTGSTVTCTTPSGIVLTVTEVSGTWTFADLTSYGTYTVDASYGSQSKTETVLIDSADTYSVSISYSRLPSGYTELDYIQSSGSQRIDTGIKPSSTSQGFTAKFMLTSASGDWNLMNMGGTGTDNYRFGFGGYRTTNFQIANIMHSNWGTTLTNPKPALNTMYELSYNYNGSLSCSLNGSTIKSGILTGSYSYTQNWNIFCQVYSSSSRTRYMTGRLYELIIYDGTTKQREFVPCINPSNVVGLYDTVGGGFYSDANGGVFTAGNPV